MSEALERALFQIARSTGADGALRALLAEAVHAAGASGGAVLETSGIEVRATYRWGGGELSPLLEAGGPVAAALEQGERWLDAPVLVAGDTSADGTATFVHLLLVPLQLRSVAAGTLLLIYRDGAMPAAAEQEHARAFAALLALTTEHDRLHEEARAARQERDHFLTALDHEIRTPAMGLALNSHLIRAGTVGEFPSKLGKVLQRIETDVGMIIRVVEGLLTLGSPGRGAAGDVVHPRETVLDLLRRVEPAANRKRLRLSLHAPRDLAVLQTDVRRFSEILLHLLSNAIKYTTEGGVDTWIEQGVRTFGAHKREPVLWVRVVDTGCGIAAEHLQRITEPFAQAEEGARTDSRSRGVGLGLAVARKLARSLGGDLLLESESGRGTTASLMLPYRR